MTSVGASLKQKSAFGFAMIVLCVLFLISINHSLPVHSQQQPITAVTTVVLTISQTLQLAPPTLQLNRVPNTNTLVFVLGPVQLIDGTILSNNPASLHINVNSNPQPLVIEGITGADGRLVFDSSRSLASQGLTLISGDPFLLTLINAQNSIPVAYGTATFNGTGQDSNRVNYAPEPIVITPPPSPRTGGINIQQISLSFLAGSLVAILYIARIKNSKKTHI